MLGSSRVPLPITVQMQETFQCKHKAMSVRGIKKSRVFLYPWGGLDFLSMNTGLFKTSFYLVFIFSQRVSGCHNQKKRALKETHVYLAAWLLMRCKKMQSVLHGQWGPHGSVIKTLICASGEWQIGGGHTDRATGDNCLMLRSSCSCSVT